MKIDTLIDIARSKRIVDLNEKGRVNPTYRRLMYTLMLYKSVYEVETVDEMFSVGPARVSGQPVYRFAWEREWLRLPNGGRKSLNLFKEILYGIVLYDYYHEKYWNLDGPCPDKYWKK